MNIRIATVLAAGILLAAAPAMSQATTLYDGSLNTLPTSQGWFFGQSSAGAGVVAITGGAASLDTTANNANQAGWGLSLPAGNLDPVAGYTLGFTIKIGSEGPTSAVNRSGYDVLVLSSDNTKSLELAVWADRIFALEGGGAANPIFTHAEEVLLDTTSTFHHFQLSVLGSAYTLYDGTTPVLNGSMRNYTSSTATLPGLPIQVYTQSRTLFIGDDTTESQALSYTQKVELTAGAIVPEPATAGLLGLSGVGLLLRRRRA